MKLAQISAMLQSAGHEHVLVTAASRESEVEYFISLLAKKIVGYANRLGNIGIKNDKATFRVADALGIKLNLDNYLEPLRKITGNRIDRIAGGNLKTWNLTDFQDVLRQLCNVTVNLLPINAEMETGRGSHRSAIAWWEPGTKSVNIPCMQDGGQHVIKRENVAHELMHAYDQFTGRKGQVDLQPGELDDYDSCGVAYYLDLREVKSRMQELTMFVRNILHTVIEQRQDNRTTLRDSANRRGWLLPDIREGVQSSNKVDIDFFADFFKSRAGFQKRFLAKEHKRGKFIRGSLPPSLEKFVDYLQGARKHVDLNTVSAAPKYKAAVDYVDRYLDALYRDWTAKYKNVLPTAAFRKNAK